MQPLTAGRASAGQNCRKSSAWLKDQQPGPPQASKPGSIGPAPLPTPPPAGLSSRRHHQIFAQELRDLKGVRTSKGQGMPPLPWQCQLLQQGRARQEDQPWGDMQGSRRGTQKETSRAGRDRGLEEGVLPSPSLCSSGGPAQALAPFPPEAAGQGEAGTSEEAAREQARHQLLRSLWGGGMGHLLQPEAVGGSPWRQG